MWILSEVKEPAEKTANNAHKCAEPSLEKHKHWHFQQSASNPKWSIFIWNHIGCIFFAQEFSLNSLNAFRWMSTKKAKPPVTVWSQRPTVVVAPFAPEHRNRCYLCCHLTASVAECHATRMLRINRLTLPLVPPDGGSCESAGSTTTIVRKPWKPGPHALYM